MVSMHWIKWRGKRLLAVAYLERITKSESLEKMYVDGWAKSQNERFHVEKREAKKGELRILEDQYEQESWCVMSA